MKATNFSYISLQMHFLCWDSGSSIKKVAEYVLVWDCIEFDWSYNGFGHSKAIGCPIFKFKAKPCAKCSVAFSLFLV